LVAFLSVLNREECFLGLPAKKTIIRSLINPPFVIHQAADDLKPSPLKLEEEKRPLPFSSFFMIHHLSSPLRGLIGAVLISLLALGLWSYAVVKEAPRILVFSKTDAFRHASIAAGQKAIQQLGKQHGFTVDLTENATKFNEQNLKRYQAVVFLNTTGDVLDAQQQNAFESYIQAAAIRWLT
jgi:hypothetical protein